MHYKLLEGQTLMAERFDVPENSYVVRGLVVRFLSFISYLFLLKY
jgi:hypothetical protein